MKQRPARQSFNVGGAHALELDANGDVVVFTREEVVVHRWATGKTEKQPWGSDEPRSMTAATLLGDESIVAATWVPHSAWQQCSIYGRDPLEPRKDALPKGPQQVKEIVASPDARFFALSRDDERRGFVDVFSADGERVQSIAQSSPLLGVVFSEDSSEVLCFTPDAIRRYAVGSRTESGFVACELPNWGGSTLISRKQGKLLLTWRGWGAERPAFVFDEAKLKLLSSLDDADVYSWGPAPGTLVRSRGGEVEVTDLAGKRRAGFRRDRNSPLQCAAPHPDGFWIAAGGFLEVYDFTRLPEVISGAPSAEKKRAAPKPPKPLAATKQDLAQGDELLAKIWADPDDEQTLRVYADWLCEHGAETRGQYIQLMLAAQPDEAQRKKAKTLLKRDRGQWLGAARPFVRSWLDASWPPGFVEQVTVEASKLVEGFEQIARLGPRLELIVTAIGKKRRETEKKLAALQFRRFAHVDLSMNGLDDQSLRTLAPALKGVRSLSLQNNPFGGQGMEALLEHGGPFEELRLFLDHRAGPSVAEDYVRALTSMPSAQKLKRLYFGGLPHLRPASLLPQLRKKLKHLEELHA